MEPFRPAETNPINDATADMPPGQDSDLAETDTVKEDHHVSAKEIPNPSLRPPSMSSVDGGDETLITLENLRMIFLGMYSCLLRYARCIVGDHHLSEDVVNTAFLNAYSKFHTFRREARIETWICRIVFNEAQNVLKKQRKFPAAITDAQLQTLIGGSEPIETVVREEALRAVRETLAKLNEEDQHQLLLRYAYDVSNTEIAEQELIALDYVNDVGENELAKFIQNYHDRVRQRSSRAAERFRKAYPDSQNGAE